MRKVPIFKVKPGMRVARTIYSTDGTLLLNTGVELRTSYIKRLKRIGVYAIYVEDEATKDVEVPEVLSDETRLEAMRCLKSLMADLSKGNRPRMEEMTRTLDEIVEEVVSNRGVLVNLADIRTLADQTFGHSVNVCVLSILTGLSLGYGRPRLKELGTGGLLHDVGKVKVPRSVLFDTDDLSPAESAEFRKHPFYGFEILRQQESVGLLCAHVAYQHHEAYDGSGYPRGLRAQEIHEYARVVALADAYDLLTADAPSRPGLPAHKALELVGAAGGKAFDSVIARAFIENIAVYPVGTVVRLSNGGVGIIVDLNRGNVLRPVVRLVLDPSGRRLDNFHELDLMKERELFIAGVVQE